MDMMRKLIYQYQRILFKIIPVVICALHLSGCATVYNPATGKQEVVFINTATEALIGSRMEAQLSRESKFVDDPRKVERLARIGEQIAAVSDRKDLRYKFNIIEDKEINAFTIPGGHVYVNSGLMEKATDPELACVIGHEIGHVAARHIAKKMQTQIGYSLLMNIVARKANISDIQTAVSITYDLISRGYSREDELEADRIGVKYAYKAGYDPRAMISFMKKMQAEDKQDSGLVFLRTHPYPDQRIKQLEQQIPLIMAEIREEKSGSNQKPLEGNNPAQQLKKASGEKAVEDESKTKNKKDGELLTQNKVKNGGESAGEAQGNVGKKTIEEAPGSFGKIVCPKCGRFFSRKINYCPHDGTKLKK